VEISADGGVGGLRIKRSSGYAMLDRSALEAVRTWKFEPGRKMGKPANMWVEVPVKFILRDNEQM
jgi:protein TonB